MNQRQLASVLFAVLGIPIAITWLPEMVVAIGLLARSTGTSTGDHAEPITYAITLLVGTLIAVLLRSCWFSCAGASLTVFSQPARGRIRTGKSWSAKLQASYRPHC